MKKTLNNTFKKKCEKVSEDLDIPVVFYDDPRKTAAFEDDGYLHLVKNGVRACFDVANAQTYTAYQQNANTKAVLDALNFKEYTLQIVFVDDKEDEEEDCCPECGREY